MQRHPGHKQCFLVTYFVFLLISSSVGDQGVLAPQTPSFSFSKLPRCTGASGGFCGAFYAQQLLDLQQPRVLSRPCPSSPTQKAACGLGVCHGDTGLCDCPAGVGGPDCSSKDSRPCTNRDREDRNSSTPASHIGPSNRDLDWRQPGWTPSRCAGVCDDATATCFCDGPHFGRVPALPGAPLGSPPIRPGRLLHGNCQRLRTDDAGRPLQWGVRGGVKYDEIYGAQGWCTVDKPQVHCSCDLDGFDGPVCELVTETVCPNQCSGHGTCNRGFCRCFAGWYGLDCARLSDPTVLNPGAAAAAAAVVRAAAAGSSGSNGGGPSSVETAAMPSGAGSGTGSAVATAGSAAVGVAGRDQKGATGNGDSSSDQSGVESTVDSVASAEQERHAGQQQAAAPEAPHTGAADLTTAAAVPEHVEFLAQNPHLSQVFVDPWFAAVPPDAAASAAAAEAAAAAAVAAAATSGAAGAEGTASAVVYSPRDVPRLYHTPVTTSSSSNSNSRVDAGGAAASSRVVSHRQGAGHIRRRRARKHIRGLKTLGDDQQQQQPQPGLEVLTEPQQLEKAQEHQHQKQQQRSTLRSLLRHFWTGGGSQRPQVTLAPQQSTVTAAVHGWLSAGSSSSSDIGGSSDGGGSSAGSNSSRNGSSDGSHSRQDGAGLRASLAAAGVQVDTLSSERDTALLMQMVDRAVGQLPAGKVRRPRIFVYDMPSRFVSRLLQYRSSKATCTWRVFSKSNYSQFTTAGEESRSAWGYPLESHLHELMLQSPHRTLDPEEADFFYVPVYAACMMEAVAGWADAPWWHVYSKSHVKQGVLMYKDALEWVRTTHPYWNASGGADHIWLFAHDEGACWAPTEIYNASIILSQWGRLRPPTATADGPAGPGSGVGRVMGSWTSKWSQNWIKWHASNEDPHLSNNNLHATDYRTLIQDHPCHTPGKDLVLPAFRPPPVFHASPFLGGDSRRTRDILLLLRGDMGRGRRAPLRQEVARIAAAGDWRRRYSTWIGTSQELPGDRSTLLARSRYCLVLPIDGWSATFEDAVLHGCIPVVVSLGTGAGGSVAADAGAAAAAGTAAAAGGGAGIAQPFSGVLRLASGMLEVPQSDLPDLPAQLTAIPPATEAALRAGLSSWWHRVTWLTHPSVKAAAAATVQANLERYPWVRSELEQQAVKQQQALASMGLPAAAAASADSAHPSSEQQEQDDMLLVPVLPEQVEGEGLEVGSESDSDSDSSSGQDGSSSGEEGSTDQDGGSSGRSDAAVSQVAQEAGASLDSSGSSNGSSAAANSSDSMPQPDGAGGTDAVQPEAVVQTDAEQVAELFAPRVWQPDGQLDDAFATLMQWLHHRLLHPHEASPPSREQASGQE